MTLPARKNPRPGHAWAACPRCFRPLVVEEERNMVVCGECKVSQSLREFQQLSGMLAAWSAVRGQQNN